MISLYRRVYASPAAMKPWGSLRYLYQPHSVMNVVSGLLCSSSSMEWYPSVASNTVFFVFAGT